MRRGAFAGAVAGAAAVVVSLLTAAPASAEPVTLVSAADQAGDVRIFTRTHGVPVEQRRGIDLRRITIERRGSLVRFQVQMKKLWFHQGFDQMVFFYLKPADPTVDGWSGSVGMSPQKPGAAYASKSDSSYEHTVSCDPMRSRSRATEALVWLDVPLRCVPADLEKIQVVSYTAFFRTDSNPYSTDRYTVPGVHVLR